MTSSSVLRQGALHAIFHDGFWKSDHEFLIAFHSNFLSGLYGFRDNEVLLQAGYDVIAISPPGGAPRDFLWRILKERKQNDTIFTKLGSVAETRDLITLAKLQINWHKIVTLAKGWSFMFWHYYTADAINTAKPCQAACDVSATLILLLPIRNVVRHGTTVAYISDVYSTDTVGLRDCIKHDIHRQI